MDKVMAKHCALMFLVTVNTGTLINAIIDLINIILCQIQQIT